MKKYVYVMKSSSGLVKVGVSSAPDARRSVLQSASGFDVSIFKLFGPYRLAGKVEGLAHKMLSDYRKKGEWFSCSEFQACSAVESALSGFLDSDISVALLSSNEEMANWAASGKIGAVMEIKEIADELLRRLIAKQSAYDVLLADFLEAVDLAEEYESQLSDVMKIANDAICRANNAESALRAHSSNPN